MIIKTNFEIRKQTGTSFVTNATVVNATLGLFGFRKESSKNTIYTHYRGAANFTIRKQTRTSFVTNATAVNATLGLFGFRNESS